MLSRVLGSASIIAASESSHPIAAFGCELRIATASDAARGVEGPPEQLGGWPAVERGGVQQALERGAGLAFPEPAGLDPASAQAGGGGEAVGADHRGQRVVAAAHG
jgi:hypothetical protein